MLIITLFQLVRSEKVEKGGQANCGLTDAPMKARCPHVRLEPLLSILYGRAFASGLLSGSSLVLVIQPWLLRYFQGSNEPNQNYVQRPHQKRHYLYGLAICVW